MARNSETAENPERLVPPTVESMFDQTSDLWERRIEWEEQRRQLGETTENEAEKGNQLVEVIAMGLAGELDDPETFVQALEAVEAVQTQRAEAIAAHLDEEPEDPCDPLAEVEGGFTDVE